MGRYEKLNEQPAALHSSMPFICFTDDPELTSETWDIRLVQPRFPKDSIRSARYLKTNGPRFLNEFTETLWIDNSVRLRVSPEEVLDAWLASADLAMPLHSYRSSVLGEFDAVATDGYDDPARVYEQLLHYSSTRPDLLDERPLWTALIARRRNPSVDEAMSLWSDHILRYSRRDQLSINHVLGVLGQQLEKIDIPNEGSLWHEWPIRVDRKWDVTTDRMTRALRPPLVEIGRLENEALQARAERDAARNDAERLASQISSIELRAAESTDAFKAHYEDSLSWRVTAPLRALRGWAGRRG